MAWKRRDIFSEEIPLFPIRCPDNFEVRHSRCFGSITKESLCTRQAV